MTYQENFSKIKKKYKIKYNEELYQHSLRDYSITLESLGSEMDFEWKYNVTTKVNNINWKIVTMWDLTDDIN